MDEEDAAFAEQKAAHMREQAELAVQDAKVFRWASESDPLEAMDRGSALLDELERATEPSGLLAMARVLVRDAPDAAATALFAATIMAARSPLEDAVPAAIQ